MSNQPDDNQVTNEAAMRELRKRLFQPGQRPLLEMLQAILRGELAPDKETARKQAQALGENRHRIADAERHDCYFDESGQPVWEEWTEAEISEMAAVLADLDINTLPEEARAEAQRLHAHINAHRTK